MELSELSDFQSEGGVIGTLICHPDYIMHTDYLKPEYFYEKENGCYYWAIKQLYSKNITNIDAYNLSIMLQSSPGVVKKLEEYNMPSVQDAMEIYTEAARHTLDEYKAFANNIVVLAFKRDLVKTLNRLSQKCFQSKLDLDALNNNVYDSLDRLTQKFITEERVHTLGEEIDSVWDEIKSRRNADGTYGILSKYPSFNQYFSYEPGELVVIQAKYKQGKSVFLMNEVIHKLQNGVPTLVYDSEMTTRLYTERLLAHLTGIEIQRIKSGNYSDEDAARIDQCIEWIKEQPLVHIYDPNLSHEKLYSICKMLKRSMGLAFVCYDYLKSNVTSTGDNYNALGAKCDFLKNQIAGELNLPVLAACQLNRQGDIADSVKINMYLSVGIKWGRKSLSMINKDGLQCGNAFAKIYVNRLGEQMDEDNEEEYIDFAFDGGTMSINEAQQHATQTVF